MKASSPSRSSCTVATAPKSGGMRKPECGESSTMGKPGASGGRGPWMTSTLGSMVVDSCGLASRWIGAGSAAGALGGRGARGAIAQVSP